MSTARGESTGAVFGFVSKLFSVLRDYRPDGVAVAFDKGDTWRHAEFTEYKATRDAMPDDMRPQMDRIEQVLDALRIPTVSLEDYEADDVLGALAQQAAAAGHDVLILTGDPRPFPVGFRSRPASSTPPAGPRRPLRPTAQRRSPIAMAASHRNSSWR